MFEHVVLLSSKRLMITWCELLGGKSGLYAGWRSTSHRMAFKWFCTLVGQMGMGSVMQQDDVISDFTMFVLDCGKQHASVTKILQEQAV